MHKTRVCQVYVNMEMVCANKQLKTGDRIRLAQTHSFCLFVPQAQKSKQGEDKAMSSLISGLTNDQSGAQFLAKEYAAHLKDRIGFERTSKVFDRLKNLQPLVDEANDLTEELRGDDSYELVFKAHVLTDITSTEQDPALAVALFKNARPDYIGEDGTFSYEDAEDGISKLVLIWPMEKFKERINAIRDLHAEISDRDTPWGEEDDDLDLWTDGPIVSAAISKTAPATAVQAEASKAALPEEGHLLRRLCRSSID